MVKEYSQLINSFGDARGPRATRIGLDSRKLRRGEPPAQTRGACAPLWENEF